MPAPAGERRAMAASSWRLAARLAHREVRRRPGRTLLVALLVAAPILAMTIGSILVRSGTDEASFARRFGTADLAVTQYTSYDATGTRLEPIDLGAASEGLVPEGTTSTEIFEAYTTVTATGTPPVLVAVTRFDPSSPITDGIVEVSSGRLPTTADEVLMHPSVADDLDTGVGDRLVLERPDRTVTVTGIGRAIADHHRPVMVFGELDRSELRDGAVTSVVDLPPGVEAREFVDSVLAGAGPFTDLQNANIELRSGTWYDDGGLQTETLAWGWVIGVLMLAAVGVIIAAAFATSARRQLATVGQLAANGASPRLIRRTLSLQGTWSGVVGSAAGCVIGVGLFLLATPLVERIAGSGWTNTTIRPVDLLVLFLTGSTAATIAALLPSRSLANTSVLQALAGRRPIRPVRARTVTAGFVCFGAGLFLLAVAAAAGDANAGGGGGGDANLFALVAVLGGVGVLAGMCLASPIAITASTAAASRLGATWKLSGRSLYRTRWRSAAVVTAIGVAGAFAVAAGTVATGLDQDREDEPSGMALDQAVVRTSAGDGNISALDPQVLRAVRAVLAPASESMIYGVDLAQPSDEEYSAAFETAPTRDGANFATATEITIADAALLDGMGLSDADRANLDEIGALALPWYVPTGNFESIDVASATMHLLGPGTTIDFEAFPIQNFTSRNGVGGIVMTEATADELGLDVIPVGIRFNSDDDLTADQRHQLDEIRFDTALDGWIVGEESADYSDMQAQQGFWIDYQYVNYTPSTALVQAAIAGAALLLVLVVVAIGLSLAAAEARDERNTLIAVGASPTTLRRRSAITAALLAVTGGVLAVPTGFIPVAVVMRTVDSAFSVPWLSILTVVVVIPVVVGLIALVGSSAMQRIRPPRILQDRVD